MPNNKLVDTRGILNFRPTVNFVEPPEITTPAVTPTATTPTTPEIANRVTQTQTIISQYNSLQNLCNLAQIQITARASNLAICLDPTLDSNSLKSLQTLFGTQYTCVSYDQYLQCLAVISQAGGAVAPIVSASDVTAAQGDTYRTAMGGFSRVPGALRPELQYASPINPINKEQFQNEEIEELIELVLEKMAEASYPGAYQLYQILFPIIKQHFKTI